MIFLQIALIFAISNVFSFLVLFNASIPLRIVLMLLGAAVTVLFCIKPTNVKNDDKRLKMLFNAVRLLKVFLPSMILDIAWLIYLLCFKKPAAADIAINSLMAVICEALVFWCGIIRVYISSVQIGIKWRIIGAACGWIPIVNLVVLTKIVKLASDEYKVETAKAKVLNKPESEEYCHTKYPILLVHGVFFRDYRFFNYWGRIPNTLEKMGAVLYYGNQQSAASVENSAEELAERIEEIVETTGCGKLNIIAHSKGGLDSRYAISACGADKYTASLTTICTPHRGCQFADFLLGKASDSLCESVAKQYNGALKKLGDPNPDFIAAVKSLTASGCEKINENCPDAENVRYFSVGSKSKKAAGGRFPLNLSYHLVKYFDGDNDGLVSVESMKWGESFELLTSKGNRGITHGDMIDLNRENFEGFDVRDYYAELVHRLKEMGL